MIAPRRLAFLEPDLRAHFLHVFVCMHFLNMLLFYGLFFPQGVVPYPTLSQDDHVEDEIPPDQQGPLAAATEIEDRGTVD